MSVGDSRKSALPRGNGIQSRSYSDGIRTNVMGNLSEARRLIAKADRAKAHAGGCCRKFLHQG